MHDILDIVKVFAVFAKERDKKYIPKLFDDTQPQFIEEVVTTNETNIQLYHPTQMFVEGLQEISKNLLEIMREPIVKKMAIEDNGSS